MTNQNFYYAGCLNQCYTCPNKTSLDSCIVNHDRRKKIWKQSRMSSSQGLLKKKAMLVSRQVGQCANPKNLLVSGGPGDYIASLQKNNYTSNSIGYNMKRIKGRLAYKNNRGVDRKHGSYQRYLARRVGGVLRKEQMPNVINRQAYIGQSRIRTGTKCVCNNRLTSKKCGSNIQSKDTACCDNRIPPNAISNCYISPSAQRTCVAGGRCSCCPN